MVVTTARSTAPSAVRISRAISLGVCVPRAAPGRTARHALGLWRPTQRQRAVVPVAESVARLQKVWARFAFATPPTTALCVQARAQLSLVGSSTHATTTAGAPMLGARAIATQRTGTGRVTCARRVSILGAAAVVQRPALATTPPPTHLATVTAHVTVSRSVSATTTTRTGTGLWTRWRRAEIVPTGIGDRSARRSARAARATLASGMGSAARAPTGLGSASATETSAGAIAKTAKTFSSVRTARADAPVHIHCALVTDSATTARRGQVCARACRATRATSANPARRVTTEPVVSASGVRAHRRATVTALVKAARATTRCASATQATSGRHVRRAVLWRATPCRATGSPAATPALWAHNACALAPAPSGSTQVVLVIAALPGGPARRHRRAATCRALEA
eukprot:PhM_4_TR3073/c0_g2_i1/m.102583